MQPGYLRVFDGLRVSTEHLEHFQDSLHSALVDLRRIAGTGRVHRGFTVTAGEGGSAEVIVQPGLAFDYDGRRLVSDEVTTLAVPALAGSMRAFVCATYWPVEEGLVDGRPTLGFDSTRLEVRTTPPVPGEATVVLATLSALSNGSSDAFVIETPSLLRNGSAPDAVLANGSEAAPETTGAPDAADAPAEAEAGAVRPTAGEAVSETVVRQGVLRLRGDESGRDPMSVLSRAMKQSSTAARAPRPAVTLASVVVAPGVLGSTWTCHAAWSVTLGKSRVRLRGMSHGEATAGADEALSQSCVYQSDVRITAGEAIVERTGSGVSESLLAGLPFAVAPGESSMAGDVPDELLAGLVVSGTLGPAVAGERSLRCELAWDGPVPASVLEWLAADPPALAWSADIVWKVTGTVIPRTSPIPPPP